MSSPAEKIQKDALELTEKERADLAYVLLQSLDDDSEAISEDEHAKAWNEEIARRMADVASGKAKLIPWEDVKREAQELLEARRQK